MRQRGGFGGLFGAPGGGAPCRFWHAWWWLDSDGRDPPLAAACNSRAGAAVDRSFLHLPTRSFCALLARRTDAASMRARVRHAWAAWRRPGAPGLSAEGPLGAWSLRDLCLPILADPGFPPVLGRRGWTSATLEWAAGRLLDFQGWPELRLCTPSTLDWRLRRPSRLEPLVCAGGGGGRGQWGGAAC